jgi:hypothetical protein
MIHNLFVLDEKVSQKSRQCTLEILNYIVSIRPYFDQFGIQIKVNKIRSIDLANPRLIDAMKVKKITELPALITPNNVYLGVTGIKNLYEQNIREYEKLSQDDNPESDLQSYYAKEMTLERVAQDNAESDALTESDKIKTAYDMAVAQRKKTERPDNVKSQDLPNAKSWDLPNAKSWDSPNAKSWDSPNVKSWDSPNAKSWDSPNVKSWDSPNVKSAEGEQIDDEDNPQDNLMESAYWNNRSPSI